MNKLIPVLLLMIGSWLTACAPAGVSFDGRKLQQVHITNVAELFSTYNLSMAEKQQVSSQIKSPALFNEILEYSKESAWPEAINTLNKRLAARATISRYHFFKVASFGNKVIVFVPADKNRHMPQGFEPTRPLYMIFDAEVVAGK